MGARSRDQRKTVRYWTRVVLKRLAEQWYDQTTDQKLLAELMPKASFTVADLYNMSTVQAVVWEIVRKWSPSKLGVICSQGVGARLNGNWKLCVSKSINKTSVSDLANLFLRYFFNRDADGKTILRELARMVIVADMFDLLKERGRGNSLNSSTCDCGAGPSADPHDHSASCPMYLSPMND